MEILLQNILDDADNRFFLDWDTQVFHDRQCPFLRRGKITNVSAFQTLTTESVDGNTLCPVCRMRMAVRNGMKDQKRNSPRQLGALMTFLAAAGVSEKDLVRLFLTENGSITYISDTCIQISVKDDSWRVVLVNGVLSLYHNNYETDESGNRSFSSGFHRQKDGGNRRFRHYVEMMCSYRYFPGGHRKWGDKSVA